MTNKLKIGSHIIFALKYYCSTTKGVLYQYDKVADWWDIDIDVPKGFELSIDDGVKFYHNGYRHGWMFNIPQILEIVDMIE